MICKLCHQEKTAKSNTHYLSDFLIKTALNEDGVNMRGKGSYFAIDSRKLHVGFKFQQYASPDKLEKMLGRKTTDIENEDAQKNIDFTVSDSFCTECEKIFTDIETKFVNNVLGKFRNSNLTGRREIVLNTSYSQILRLLFLLQFWRTSVCSNEFKISEKLSEHLRLKILHQDYSGLEDIPLSVTYLETIKEPDDPDVGSKYKTDNLVMPLARNEPYAIVINDFVAQLYEKGSSYPFFKFNGMNNDADYIDYLNVNRPEYRVKIINNRGRKMALSIYYTQAAQAFKANHVSFFFDMFSMGFKRLPTNSEVQGYLDTISRDKDLMKFTTDKIVGNIINYFRRMGIK